MKRRIFSMLAAVSLVLSAGTLAMWEWSYGPNPRYLPLPTRADRLAVGAFQGEIGFIARGSLAPTAETRPVRAMGWERGPFHLSFMANETPPLEERRWTITVRLPCWLLVLLFAFPPALWVQARQRWKREDRRRAGRCANCGYDLRAHCPGQRCPECGEPVPAGGVKANVS